MFLPSLCLQFNVDHLVRLNGWANGPSNHFSPLAVMVPETMVPENGEVEMDVKLEVEMEDLRSKWMHQFYHLLTQGRLRPRACLL